MAEKAGSMSKKIHHRAIAASTIAALSMLTFAAPALADNTTAGASTCEAPVKTPIKDTDSESGEGTVVINHPKTELTAEELQAILDSYGNANGNASTTNPDDNDIKVDYSNPKESDSNVVIIIKDPAKDVTIDNDKEYVVTETVDKNTGDKNIVIKPVDKEAVSETVDTGIVYVEDPIVKEVIVVEVEDPAKPEPGACGDTDSVDNPKESTQTPVVPDTDGPDLGGMFGSLSSLSGLLKF